MCSGFMSDEGASINLINAAALVSDKGIKVCELYFYHLALKVICARVVGFT